MQSVFVEIVKGRVPREIARDARDPIEQRDVIEQVALTYSRRGKRVRVFADGPYIAPWRRRLGDPLFEAFDGAPAEGWA